MSRRLTVLAAGALAGWAAVKLRRAGESFSFQDKTVLITGGSRGLGLVLARDAAAEGAKVAICGRDVAALERAAAVLERIGATVIAVPADITVPESVRALVETVAKELGPIDVLINNAGVIEVGPSKTMALSDYEEAMATNFWGMVYPTLQVLPSMRERGGGRIVNITSIGGKLGIPHLLPYSASKFAALGFSQGLRAEVKGEGVAVTTAIPGLMRTGSPRNAISAAGTAPSTRGSHRRLAARCVRQRRRGIAADSLRRAPGRRGSALPRRGQARGDRIGGGTEPDRFRTRPRRPAAAGRAGKRDRTQERQGQPVRLLSLLAHQAGDEAARRYNQVAPAEGSSA